MTTPQIRFGDFKDQFAEEKLNTIAERVTRRNKDLETTLPLTISAKYGLVDQVTYFNNRVASGNLENYLLLRKGDFAYNKSSSDGFPFGTVKQLKKYDLGALSVLYIAFRPKAQSVSSTFLDVYFETDNWHRAVEIRAAEGARNHGLLNISADDFLEIPLRFPLSVLEQNKIGEFFQDINGLLESQVARLDHIKNLKQSMLVKMFPQAGSSVPEIRFEGFDGEWVVFPLFDVVKRIIDFRGRTPKKLGMDWSKSGHLALSANNVKQGFIDFSRDPHYGDDELYSKWMSGRELHEGQVLFTTEAPLGNVALVPDSRKYILSQRVIAFVLELGLVNESFFAVLLTSPGVLTQITELSSGGTAKGISQRSLEKIYIVIPRQLEEQRAISNYFSNLDNLIGLEEEKLNKLKNLKNSFLNKMFV